MGKTYRKELLLLAKTYRWAYEVPLAPLKDFFTASNLSCPLLTVGSGGSATAAHFAAMLHRSHAAAFARHVTPLEILLEESILRDASVLLLSASGKNRDVLAALKCSIDHETRALATLSTRVGSPLAKEAQRFERSYIFEADVPGGKDGFLATNSLLATCTIIARAYGVNLSDSISSFESEQRTTDDIADCFTVLILYAGWAAPVATDLESKLHESAIASAQVSDYRNFGHGRHFWLARRASKTIVITLITPETSTLADRTRALLPADIPIIELRTPYEGAAGTIDLLVQGFLLIGKLGEFQGFDPGRPNVPAFGRKLYHLAPKVLSKSQPPPVARKLVKFARLNSDCKDEVILVALERFVDRLCSTKLGGIVFDYDGTLCASTERFDTPRKSIVDSICRLLEGGLFIGVATGRGSSVRNSLQKVLPESVWKSILVGYYNGGAIGLLSQNNIPSRDDSLEHPMSLAISYLKSDPLLDDIATLTPRCRQIAVEPTRSISNEALMSHVMTVLAPLEDQGIRVLASSHSVDVLAPSVSKLAVVRSVQQQIQQSSEVLCIGDRGAWPGNDCALLSHTPSLSVDEVSSSLATCWNLASAGKTGIDATLCYLEAIDVTNGIARFDARNLWRQS